MTKIGILLHGKERPSRTPTYLLWGLRDVWLEQGLEVEVFRGMNDEAMGTDVLFNHIDLTVVPDPYLSFLARHPRVVNGGAADISKRRVSEQLVGPDDDWPGPVIVKSNLNATGSPERRLVDRSFFTRARRRAAHMVNRGPKPYPVFPTIADVPASVFRNETLVVERFLPEMDDGFYCLRTLYCLGGQVRAYRAISSKPVVKSENVIRREEIEPRDDLIDERKRLGLDYGKLDFVIHDGTVVLIDANKTPSTAVYPPGPKAALRNKFLAQGIHDWI